MKRKKMMGRRDKGDGCFDCTGRKPKNRLTKMRHSNKKLAAIIEMVRES